MGLGIGVGIGVGPGGGQSSPAPRNPSFIEKFGEPISGYSLRNLTSNPEQAVVQVSTDGELFFDQY